MRVGDNEGSGLAWRHQKQFFEVDITVKDKTWEVEVTSIKTVERDRKQIAAKTTMENARRALEN